MIKDIIKNIAGRTGYRFIKKGFLDTYYHRNDDPKYRRSGDLNPLEQLFYKYIEDDFFFIQVGANDGKRYDPVHHLVAHEKDKVRGIAIEPVEEYFNELLVTYKDFPGITLVNKAIHNTHKEETIYKIVQKEDTEERLKGMSSFDIENFLKEGIAADQVIAEKVPCISFMELVKQENVKKVHLLQIDAEGYDVEIIKSIDFNIIKPLIINFEHRWQYNLVPEPELFTIFRMLMDHGYTMVLNGNDALAYLT